MSSDATVTVTPTNAAVHRPLWQAADQSLLAQLDGLLGPRYRAFVVGVAVVLLLLLALAAWATAGGRGPFLLESLRTASLNPAVTVYILAVHPFMHRRWLRAIESLRALSPHAGDDEPPSAARRRGEWVAMAVGAVLGLALAHQMPGAHGWLLLYVQATSALTIALLAAAIYGSVGRSRHLAAHSRAGLALNVFDAHLLTPFARWGQSLTLVFVGGICLSLLFQSTASLRSIEGALVYGSLIVVALALFFTSMWTVHVALAHARDQELARVRADLQRARAAMQRERAVATTETRDVHDAYVPAVVLGQYERQVLAAPTWPFNPTIVRRVFASAAAPLGLYLLKIALGVAAGASP